MNSMTGVSTTMDTVESTVSNLFTYTTEDISGVAIGINNSMNAPPPSISFTLLKDRCCMQPPQSGFITICHIFKSNFDYVDYESQFSLTDASKYILVILYSLIIAISLPGNILVLLTFIYNKSMRSTTNVYILSLAVSNLLLAITATPFNLANALTTFWEFGSFACKLVPFIMTFCVACSSLTLCCIAFDRFYAIVYPFRVKFFQTSARTVPLLCSVWTISLLAAVPQVVYYELLEFKSVCKTYKVCILPVIDGETEFFQLWLPFLILFGFPFLIMLILYGIIIGKLWGRKQIGVNVRAGDSFRLKQKRRAIKMLITVMALFVVCWLPSQTFNAFSEKSSMTPDVALHWKLYLHCLALSSSCYNPFVYAFMNENFRKNFAQFLKCRKRRVFPIVANQTAVGRSNAGRGRNNALGNAMVPPSKDTIETKI